MSCFAMEYLPTQVWRKHGLASMIHRDGIRFTKGICAISVFSPRQRECSWSESPMIEKKGERVMSEQGFHSATATRAGHGTESK